MFVAQYYCYRSFLSILLIIVCCCVKKNAGVLYHLVFGSSSLFT